MLFKTCGKALLIISLFMFCIPGFGAGTRTASKSLYDWKSDIPLITRQVDSIRTVGSHLTIRDFVIKDDTLFISPEGTLYLFRWDAQKKKAVLLGHPKYHGYNFQKYLFSYNHRIYSLGGYGFWHQHSLLTVFDPSSQEWEMVPIKGSMPHGKPTFCCKIGDRIYCFGFANDKFDSDYDDLKPTGDIYTLDLRTFEWKNTYKSLDEGTTRRSASLENDDWYINRTIVIDKKNLMLYSAKLALLLNIDLPDGRFPYIDGDRLYNAFALTDDNMGGAPISLTSRISETGNYVLDLKSMNARIFVHRYGTTAGLIALAVVALIALIFIFRFLRRHGRGQNADDEVGGIIERLERSGKQVFSVDELDELLEIDRLTTDSRKIKRSQLLKKLDESHPGMIARERSAADKRVFDYRYTPENR